MKDCRSGQVLLIVIMLLATVMTVVLTVTFRSTTETQVTKMEEESQKALAAAEAAIEASLKIKGPVTLGQGDLGNISGFTGGATIETAATPTFVTPLLEKDEQYTFYMANYPGFTTVWSNSNGMNYYFNTNNDCVALEFTSIRHSDKSVHKAVANNKSGCSRTISGSAGSFVSITCTAAGYTVDNEKFYCKTNITGSVNNTDLLFIRPLFSSTKVAIVSEPFTGAAPPLPIQGKIISSSAQSTTGVTKKVELFQSYPQIPAEFFVTRF